MLPNYGSFGFCISLCCSVAGSMLVIHDLASRTTSRGRCPVVAGWKCRWFRCKIHDKIHLKQNFNAKASSSRSSKTTAARSGLPNILRHYVAEKANAFQMKEYLFYSSIVEGKFYQTLGKIWEPWKWSMLFLFLFLLRWPSLAKNGIPKFFRLKTSNV